MTNNANLFAILEQAFARASEAIAFDLGQEGQISYGALSRRVGQMANALESLGVAPGDRVTAQVEKSIANVCLYLATMKCGAIYNPLNTAYTAAELGYFLADAEPRLLVVPDNRRGALEGAVREAGVQAVETMEADGGGSLTQRAEAMESAHATAFRQPDDLAALIYTSGTTGRSKGAMITHENLSSNARVLHDYWGFVPGDVLLHALPVFHVHGLFVALHTAFLNGSRMLWRSRFDVEEVMRLLPEATVMMGVPTFYTRLLAREDFTRDQCRSMRLFVSGSAPLLAETHQAFQERLGHRILERYGMTEAGMITSNPYQGGQRVAGTVGYALPGISLRVADAGGRELARGDIGTLEVRGPNVFKGYWRMPEKTAEEFRDDGYFITGDMATIAEDGRVSIVGRSKDLIISGGFNVYPKEIEQELDQLEGIGESAVIGLAHPDFGEGVVAVVTSAGSVPANEADIISALDGRLARFKLPKRVFVVDALPRNAMGKVQKAELRVRFAGTFEG